MIDISGLPRPPRKQFGPGMKTTTVIVPRWLHLACRLKCERAEMSLSWVLSALLQLWVEGRLTISGPRPGVDPKTGAGIGRVTLNRKMGAGERLQVEVRVNPALEPEFSGVARVEQQSGTVPHSE